LATGIVTVTDNIVFNNGGVRPARVFGAVDGRLSGFDIEGNVLFGNGSISTPANRTTKS